MNTFPFAGRFLAFDTSTERMSVAVSHGTRVWTHEGPGAAQSSSTLIPAVMDLLAQAGLTLTQLDAIAFGRGPGSFTGLRTACAVAQGLAAGASVPVLPVDTLLALAEAAREQAAIAEGDELLALLDARMDEIYTQRFVLSGGRLVARGACVLRRPEQLLWAEGGPGRAGDLMLVHEKSAADTAQAALSPENMTPVVFAGNVFSVYADRLPAWPAGSSVVTCLPSAAALLRLAPGLMQDGLAVPADQALPLYVRDKVAQTTDERMQAKAALQQAAAEAAAPTP